MPHRNKFQIPQEVREDKPENERKYSITGVNWRDRSQMLNVIFNHVAGCSDHFATLNMAPHTDGYHPDLLQDMDLPADIIYPRTRFYWANINLKGYRPTDRFKGEVRTEEKVEKDAWQQVVKLGGNSNSGRTLSRGEYKRLLDGFGTNLGVYKGLRKDVTRALGNTELKPLVRLQGQTKKIFYHPHGDRKTLLEIKFDKVKGQTFDGFGRDIIEIEVEVKRGDKKATKREMEAMLDQTEQELLRRFADNLTPIYHSKVYELFQHLYGWQLSDKKNFREAFQSLPGDSWAEYPVPNPSLK